MKTEVTELLTRKYKEAGREYQEARREYHKWCKRSEVDDDPEVMAHLEDLYEDLMYKTGKRDVLKDLRDELRSLSRREAV